jgi:hypothetical protein
VKNSPVGGSENGKLLQTTTTPASGENYPGIFR